MLDLLWLEGRRELQGHQRLQTMTVWRRSPLSAGGLCDITTTEEILALLDEGLDDGLVEFGGGQRILVLKIRPHERRPETDGEIVGRHQRGLALLTYPGEEKT